MTTEFFKMWAFEWKLGKDLRAQYTRCIKIPPEVPSGTIGINSEAPIFILIKFLLILPIIHGKKTMHDTKLYESEQSEYQFKQVFSILRRRRNWDTA